MKIKPFLNVVFCYKCGCPIPRVGVSMRTNSGSVSASTPIICPKCSNRKRK